jgi:hypothetical protein
MFSKGGKTLELLKKIYLGIANKAQPASTYRIRNTSYQISLDLEGIQQKLTEATGQDVPLIGGLDNGASPFSFGGYLKKFNILLIKPDQYERVFFRPRWTKTFPLIAIVAYLAGIL